MRIADYFPPGDFCMHKYFLRRAVVGLAVLALALPIPSALAASSSASTEVLVLVRHGEKPTTVDNGQLTCQGQNRALALPGVLLANYGMPNYLFAGGTVSNTDSNGNVYYYIRALATIEPTAVAAGLTVNLKYANSDYGDLASELEKSKYASALIFVALEHNDLDSMAALIVKKFGGDPSVVPAWPDDDFDSIFVITITQSGSTSSVTFDHDYEGLNNRSTECGVPSGAQRILPPPLPINR
jgi:hypothetical protein